MKDKKTALTIHFADLEDPRVVEKTSHLLIDIIVMAICSVLAGASGIVYNFTDNFAADVYCRFMGTGDATIQGTDFDLNSNDIVLDFRYSF